jgi:hypothetical protein
LNGRQEQGDQDADDGDDHQQLDQSETTTTPARGFFNHDRMLWSPLATRFFSTDEEIDPHSLVSI